MADINGFEASMDASLQKSMDITVKNTNTGTEIQGVIQQKGNATKAQNM